MVRKNAESKKHDVAKIPLWYFAIGLIAAAAAVFFVHYPALHTKAISFDDDQYLVNNFLVQNPGWESAWRFLREVLKPTTVEGYYQPLTMISLMLDYAMGGRPDNPTIFHLTSLIFHIFNTALIIILLHLLFRNFWVSLIAGLIFGLHPMTVETIPWIGERKTLLAAFFGLFSLISYVIYAQKGEKLNLFVCLIMYILALMSKPTVTMLPVMFLLMDFWPLKRFSIKSILEKIPLFAIMALSAVITIISQGKSANVRMPNERTLWENILMVCHNIIFYLHKIIWPANLTSHYPIPELSLNNPVVLVGFVGTIILLTLLAISLFWTRMFAVGWLIFFVMIFPTIGILGFSIVITSDKYAYFPCLGFLIVLAYILSKLFESKIHFRIIVILAAIFIFAAESKATRDYLIAWKDTESLYKHMIKIAPNSWSLHNNLGTVYFKQERFTEATVEFQNAIQLMPKDPSTNQNVAAANYLQGKAKASMDFWQASLKVKPDWIDGLNNLAWAKATQQDTSLRDPKGALELSKRACELTEYSKPETLDTLAVCYAATGDFKQALDILEKALILAKNSSKTVLVKEIEAKIELFKAGKPYIERAALSGAK
jgi:Tfp pilus assembly protein PilF